MRIARSRRFAHKLGSERGKDSGWHAWLAENFFFRQQLVVARRGVKYPRLQGERWFLNLSPTCRPDDPTPPEFHPLPTPSPGPNLKARNPA